MFGLPRRLFDQRAQPALLALLMSLAAAAASAAVASPEEVVARTSDRVLATIEDKGEALKEDRQRLYALVAEIVLPHFDFRRMSMRVLGRHWRDATKGQRTRFIEEFKTLLVRTYSSALLDYADATVEIQPVRAAKDAKSVVVRTRVRATRVPSLGVNYHMYRAPGGWKVYDVAIEGVSLVITYRTSFSEEIKSAGLDRLIDELASRNRGEQG